MVAKVIVVRQNGTRRKKKNLGKRNGSRTRVPICLACIPRGVGACPFQMRDRCGYVSAVWDCARRAYVSDSASWRADLSGMGAGLRGNRLPGFGVGRAPRLGLEGVRGPGGFPFLPAIRFRERRWGSLPLATFPGNKLLVCGLKGRGSVVR